jgi:hypothetical protein
MRLLTIVCAIACSQNPQPIFTYVRGEGAVVWGIGDICTVACTLELGTGKYQERALNEFRWANGVAGLISTLVDKDSLVVSHSKGLFKLNRSLQITARSTDSRPPITIVRKGKAVRTLADYPIADWDLFEIPAAGGLTLVGASDTQYCARYPGEPYVVFLDQKLRRTRAFYFEDASVVEVIHEPRSRVWAVLLSDARSSTSARALAVIDGRNLIRYVPVSAKLK